MWDGTDESSTSNLDRSERSRTKLNVRSRRRSPEPPRAVQPQIPARSRRERARKPLSTKELPPPVRPVRRDPPKTEPRQRRRLEVVPSPESRRAQPVKKSVLIPKSRSALAILYSIRLLILGIGVSVIAGTSLSIWDPANRFGGASQTEKLEQIATPTPTAPAVPQLELAQEITPLKAQIQTAIAAQPQLIPGLTIVDADSRTYLDINGSTAIAAASTIKFPILVAFFQAVDEGKIRLDEPLTMRKELIATESGELQDLPIGSQFPAIDVATKMIDISDNTATNMMIDRLGGKDALNQRFQSWGLASTTVQTALPDLQGTNMSSPRDMVSLLNAVNRGQLVSIRSRERLLDIMRKVINNSLIPQGLGQGATIAHKTGDIGTMLGDVGIIDLPNGKRYLMAAMVKRPHNDDRAGDVIRQFSKLAYQYFSQQSETTPASPNSQGAQPPRSTIAQP